MKALIETKDPIQIVVHYEILVHNSPQSKVGATRFLQKHVSKSNFDNKP
jgi:hypothetical protein